MGQSDLLAHLDSKSQSELTPKLKADRAERERDCDARLKSDRQVFSQTKKRNLIVEQLGYPSHESSFVNKAFRLNK